MPIWRFSALSGALLVVFIVHGAAGCGRRPMPSNPGVTFDPELVDSDPGSFYQRFDGSAGKVTLGTGWYGLEQIEKTGPWSNFSWAARSAHVYFGVPLSHEVELVARLAPFSYPGAAPQTLTPIVNGTALPPVAVPADWQELRVPLPANLLRAPLNDLQLDFAYSAAPSKVIESGDPRELAAVVQYLAILPRGRPALAPVSSVRGEGASREVTLQGEGLALPLPAGSRYRLRVGGVRSREPGTSLSVHLLHAGSRQALWKGSAAELSGLTLDFKVEEVAKAGMLLLRAQTASGSALPSEASVVLELTAPEVSSGGGMTLHPGKPDIFLYVIDTLGASALGTYGARLPTSPRIDAFARDAITYERAWSTSSWTLPATVSILSGVYPFEHGMAEASERLPAEGVPWLPELLSQLDYETVAISQWPLSKPFGLQRGFGTYTLDVRLMK